MKTIAVIPARLASTRLPRKMLREIAGKPLVGWVYEAVRSSPLLSDVIIATDSEEILEACRKHGWKAQMTSASHRSGTERVHEISNSVTADVYVNVQGDEPLVRPEQIAALLEVMKDPAVQVGTVKTPCPTGRNSQSQRGQSRDRSGRPRSLFFPRHDPFRPRQHRPALLQASWPLCLPESCARSFCEPAGIDSRKKRTAGTAAFPRKRNRQSMLAKRLTTQLASTRKKICSAWQKSCSNR